MELLESAMAFAVVMIILSTIVSGIVEVGLRALRWRERTLKQTVVTLFDTVVWPRLESQLRTMLIADGVAGSDRKSSARARFLAKMLANPAFGDPPTDKAPTAKKSVSVLTPLAFTERLARTDVGKAILDQGKEEVDLLVKDFVRTFDRFGRAASEKFRKNATFAAIVVGLIFAFATNVTTDRIFVTLFNNPDIRTALIENANEASQGNSKVLAKIESALNDPKNTLPPADLEELKADIQTVKEQFGTLAAKGIPLGYGYFPYCANKAARNCNPAVEVDWEHYVFWAFFTALAGILIGLGGPFWFRVFSSLSQVFQVLRSLGVGKKDKQAKPEELDPLPSAEESTKPKDVLDAFMVAAKVHSGLAANATGSGRRFID
ncbi:MAG: hypothetical protein RIC87_17450 [Kiloniellales bacterium]